MAPSSLSGAGRQGLSCLHSLACSPGLSLSPWMSDSQIHALPLFGRGEGHPSWLPTEEGVNYWNRDKKQVPDMPRNIRSWKTGPPCPVCCCLSFPITLRPSPMPLPPRGTDGEHGRKNFHSPSGSTRGPGPLPPAQ